MEFLHQQKIAWFLRRGDYIIDYTFQASLFQEAVILIRFNQKTMHFIDQSQFSFGIFAKSI